MKKNLFEKNTHLFLKELKQFNYSLDYIDKTWDIIFPDKKNKWHHIRVTQYQEIFYIPSCIYHSEGDQVLSIYLINI